MDWDSLRAEFPVTRHWAFLDHAAVAPLSGRAQSALCAYAADLAANGDVNEHDWVRRIEEVLTEAQREAYHKALGAPFDLSRLRGRLLGNRCFCGRLLGNRGLRGRLLGNRCL